jgi:hypothetical protein
LEGSTFAQVAHHAERLNLKREIMRKASNYATVPQGHNPAGMPKASLDLVRSSLVELHRNGF